MRLLGERLAKSGWTILGIQLSGHGTTPEDMAKTGWEDWAKDAEDGVRKLRKSCDTVVGVGLSMGGLLTLHLATLGLIDGLISMNAPMVLADRRTRFARLARPFVKFVGKRASMRAASESISKSKIQRFVYDRIPVDGLVSLNRGIRQVRSRLRSIKCPALLMQSTKDFTVNPNSVQIIRKEIEKVNPVVIYWEKSGHILTLGPEREEVALKVQDFLQQFTAKEHL